MSGKKNKQEVVREATEGLLEMFRTGKMPEAVALTIIRRKEGDDQPSFHWSIGNQIIMMMHGTSDARGFKQWQEVGRYVRKGARAIHILGPMTRRITEKDPDTGQETEKTIITGFRTIPVFRYEDTDGQPLDKPDYTPEELPPFWNVAEYLGAKIEYTPCHGGYYGAYSPSKDRITLCSQDAVVYFHELSHAVHGQIKELKPGQDAEQEIVAELSAAVLCQLQEIAGFENQSYDYIKHYTSKMKETDILKVIMRVLSDVEAVVTRIITIAEQLEYEEASLV